MKKRAWMTPISQKWDALSRAERQRRKAHKKKALEDRLARLKRHRDELVGVLKYSERFDGSIEWSSGERLSFGRRIRELEKGIEKAERQLTHSASENGGRL